MVEPVLLLGIDTCGPVGSLALARLTDGKVEILGEKELAGRSYSATLVAAVGGLLAAAGTGLDSLYAIVAVNGPGSFTGVRVGLSAAKGLSEGTGIPVVTVSRLEVLAWKAGVPSDRSASLGSKAGSVASALDAQRGEVFLRISPRVSPRVALPVAGEGSAAEELLAGPEDLARIGPALERIGVCDESAALLVGAAWPEAEIVRTTAPTAAEALELGAPKVTRREFVDVALLDGHYLRRPDAEISSALSAAGTRHA